MPAKSANTVIFANQDLLAFILESVQGDQSPVDLVLGYSPSCMGSRWLQQRPPAAMIVDGFNQPFGL